MYTLDANIFVRDLDTREPQHAECHALLDELQA
jgi:predicted nucleic acid-binding protein